MTTDLDDLLRSTFDARAATVNTGPAWEGVPARRSRTPWIAAAAAAAVTMLGLACGVAYLQGSGTGTTPSGGDVLVRTTCNALLPDAWSSAVEKGVVTFHGEPVVSEAVTASGTVIGEVGIGSGHTTVVAVPSSGEPRTLLTMPGARIVAIDAGDRYAVVSSAPVVPADNPHSPVDRITVVDLHNGSRTDLLSDLPPSTPRVVLAKYGAVLQNDTAYWIAGASRNATHGAVVSYDIRTKRYSTVGHAATPEIDRDVRGVGWVGGSVSAPGVPSGLPAFFSASGQYQPVYSDGHTIAWQEPGSHTIRVLTSDGSSLALRVDDDATLFPTIEAVSGDFVFYGLNDTPYTGLILDVRTHARAYLTYGAEEPVDASYPSLLSPHGVSLSIAGGARSSLIQPDTLPDLHC